MDNPAIEQLAAEQVLQDGARMKMRAPLMLRLLGKKFITLRVRSLTMGTMQRVSRYYLSTGLKEEQLDGVSFEEALAIMSAHGVAISKAVACAWLNGYWRGRLFTRPLAWMIREGATPAQVLNVTTLILVYGGVQDFMSTTRSVRVLKTMSHLKPNLGQKTKGS